VPAILAKFLKKFEFSRKIFEKTQISNLM